MGKSITIILLILLLINCKSTKIPPNNYRIEWRDKGRVAECDYASDFEIINFCCILYTNIIGQKVVRCGEFEVIKLKK